jgi:tetratricopeptide (TPR) repeat protein
VAFTGRLSSLTRIEAAEVLAVRGASLARCVTRATTLLAVGERALPLGRTGRLSRNLQAARALQMGGHAIEIISEDELLHRLGWSDQRAPSGRCYSVLELVRVLGVGRDRLRNWIRAGFITAVERRGEVPYFDFRQVSRAKHLLELIEAGVAPASLRRSLLQIRRWTSNLDETLRCLSRLERDGRRLVLEDRDGALLEPHGQLLFRFADDETPPTVPFRRETTSDDLFAAAVKHEEEGRFREAAAAYDRLLEREGPDAVVCFNLANSLYAAGQPEAAAQHYRQVVELDPQSAEAWNNLGNVLAELGDYRRAVAALQRALSIVPSYPDAHYSLADALDETGAEAQARPHWEAYLRAEPIGEWADHARRRLQGRFA